MAITLAPNALTTLDTLKETLSIDPGDTSKDQQLLRMINTASDLIEGECSRKFARAVDYVERVRGYGSQVIQLLEKWPVESITSIKVGDAGTNLPGSSYRLQDSIGAGIWSSGGWPFTGGYTQGAISHDLVGDEEDSIVVTYTGGFALPQNNRTPGQFPLPFDLEEACLQLATYRFRMIGRNLGLQAETVGNASKQYGGGVSGLPSIPNAVMEALTRYKRFR